MAGTLTYGFHSNQKIAMERVIDVISYKPVEGVMHQHFFTVILNSICRCNGIGTVHQDVLALVFFIHI